MTRRYSLVIGSQGQTSHATLSAALRAAERADCGHGFVVYIGDARVTDGRTGSERPRTKTPTDMHVLSDKDRDLMDRLIGEIEAAITEAEDPGAVLGGTLPVYLAKVFGQGRDQHGPFFDCLDVMLTIYATQYRRFDILQGVADICTRIRAMTDRALSAGRN